VAQTRHQQNIQGVYACTSTSFYIVSDSDSLIHQSKAQVPFLRRFAADWATAEIVRIQLKNRRSYAKRVNLPEDVNNQGDVNDRSRASADDDDNEDDDNEDDDNDDDDNDDDDNDDEASPNDDGEEEDMGE